MLFIGMLSFIMGAYHVYTVGLSIDTGTCFIAATIIIAVTTWIKTFNWIATMRGGSIEFEATIWYL